MKRADSLKGKKIFVSTVAFSGNDYLKKVLSSTGAHVMYNPFGRRLSSDELIKILNEGYEYAIIGLDKITSEILSKLNGKLKVISKYGVGIDNIDIKSCNKQNIRVVTSDGVNKRSVSELALGSILSLCRNIYVTSNELKNGVWNKNGGVELSYKTVGIIGLGNIGKDLVRLLQPFNCKILVNDIAPDFEFIEKNDLILTEKEQIYSECDIISLHIPLTKLTQNLITKKELGKMKRNSILINTARGELVNLKDLEYFLKTKRIGGASIDVYDIEPPTNMDLLSIKNLINTPHIGGNSYEAVIAMGLSAIDNLINIKNEA